MQGNGVVDFLLSGRGAGFVLLFLAAWCVTGYLAAWMSGWRVLAQLFPCEREFDGQRWRFQSGAMRWSTNYNGVLTMGANRDGIYLAMFFAFRPGHPPLFIPWNEITTSDRRRLFAGTQFVLGREAQIPLWVFKKMGDRLLAFRPAEDDAMQGLYSRPGLEDPRPIA